MAAFEEAYQRLNVVQRKAVDYIDGPLLVIAGPGTGKTQLLSARVANILHKTDTLPQNILCLTFTESGAANMRERLTRFIGQSAYDVNIGTYHAFGGELIRRFPEYFAETRLQEPIDDLGKHQILQNIINSLSYANPLKQLQHHLQDLKSTISEVKRALLSADDLRAIATENAACIEQASGAAERIFADTTRMPTKFDKAEPLFEQLLAELRACVPKKPAHQSFQSLATVAVNELASAMEQAREIGKTTPLTKWKNTWLAKNGDNQFVLAGELQNRRIAALAGVFEQYETALAKNGWYDFDDMILRAIRALETNADLRFTLQEQYLYLLLDEFQDTNAAQAKLVQLLTDNPVNEGRPNVMAVGDDDQAIYAFQGADVSNMLDFYHAYRDVAVLNLTDNYRSHRDVLHTAHNIAGQIEARLQHHFEGMSKTLVAARDDLPAAHVIRQEFSSSIAEYDWIAAHVEALTKKGVAVNEIAVLAPGHKHLTTLVPYLNARNIPVRYEKRENILDAPVVQQLLAMCKLVLALEKGDEPTANALWPEVLSFDFWRIPVSHIWGLSWQVADDKAETNWSKALLAEPDFVEPALLFLTLAHKAGAESCETMLDYLIGTEAVATNEPETPSVRSPLRAFCTSKEVQREHPELLYDTLSHLTVLRAKLREHQATQEDALRLQDLMSFVDMYQAAGERMINTSPYNQQADAVQLMTVFKAKGLEFAHVFLPHFEDDVWGSSARGNSNKLTLPANLAPIRYAGASEDERLRILFVAVTRAKVGLYLTSSTQNYAGKIAKRVKYTDEQPQPDGSFKALTLPAHAQTVQRNDHDAPALAALERNWHDEHLAGTSTTQLQGLLRERLAAYQLSPTHLNTFTDMEYGGPQKFFFNTLLRFPQAPSVSSQFGNAIHETMEWIQHQTTETGSVPVITAAINYFGSCLRAKKLPLEQAKLQLERGERALAAYLAKKSGMFKPGDKAEHNFRHEGVFAGEARLGGKIDRMEIDKAAKTITVVDYKTGKSFAKWESTTKLHKYRQQLYCYKLLIEGSHTFAGYTVAKGRLEFIEPDQENRINSLEVTFDKTELMRIAALLQAMWQHVQRLDFPTTTAYEPSLRGIKAFETDLLEGKI